MRRTVRLTFALIVFVAQLFAYAPGRANEGFRYGGVQGPKEMSRRLDVYYNRMQRRATELAQRRAEGRSTHDLPPIFVPMLWGPPGIGKSQIVRQVARAHGVPMLDVRLSQVDPVDLRGALYRDGDEVRWTKPADLPNPSKHGERGIVFLDEINTAPTSVQTAGYQLILDRKLGQYALPDGWVVVAAGNRMEDKGATLEMKKPLANRFKHYSIVPKLKEWTEWAVKHGVDPRVVSFLQHQKGLLFKFDSSSRDNPFPTPRTWHVVSGDLAEYSGENRDLLFNELVGAVGSEAGSAFHTYLDKVDRIPPLQQLLSGEAKLPTGAEHLDIHHFVAQSLANHVMGDKRSGGELSDADKAQIAPRLEQALGFATDHLQGDVATALLSDLHQKLPEELLAERKNYDRFLSKFSKMVEGDDAGGDES